jgi:8-oxo-dGTP pyrophosphatase MutT (NUDIX family)
MNNVKELVEYFVNENIGEIRKKVEVLIFNGNKILIAEVKKGSYLLPGGGIEGNDSLEETAKKECLEEIGVRIKNVRKSKYTHYYEIDQNDSRFIKAGRMSYKGLHTTLMLAEFDGEDKSLFNIEGDGMPYKWVTIDSAIKILGQNEFKIFAEWRVAVLNDIKKNL